MQMVYQMHGHAHIKCAACMQGLKMTVCCCSETWHDTHCTTISTHGHGGHQQSRPAEAGRPQGCPQSERGCQAAPDPAESSWLQPAGRPPRDTVQLCSSPADLCIISSSCACMWSAQAQQLRCPAAASGHMGSRVLHRPVQCIDMCKRLHRRLHADGAGRRETCRANT